ncbi:MAG: cadmium-translocating P-type ATPase, partial [Lachnospiraceae bacterium]|nr:cadmium-translocating P-type ATPase [Lachnospiraceae bacterium]
MNKKQKCMILRIVSSAILYAAIIILEKAFILKFMDIWWICLLLYIVPYLVIGYDIIFKAVRNIFNGQVFDENFLMCVATFGAFGIGEYSEAVAVMLFYQVGELFQSYAVNKSRQSITELMDICPEYANIEVDGSLKQVDPDDVNVGDIITVKPGERIPLDGKIIKGTSMIDTSALTGESVPRKAEEGSEVISGCVNGSGTICVEVTKEFDDSTVSKILELVENASSKKAKVENFITKFARYYTPIVVIAAVVLAILPPLILGSGWASWIKRACIFLVISCPCALVISVPLSFFGGIGAASKNGILIKGSNYLESLSNMKTVVFDKTGTITKGEFKVQKLIPSGLSENELLELAAYAEGYSDHPISKSIKEAYGKNIDLTKVDKAQEISGHGIKVKVNGKEVYAGNEKLMVKQGIPFESCQETGTVVYLSVEGKYVGCILISDAIKEGTSEALKSLKGLGITKTIMLTGDRKYVGESVASELKIDQVYTELLPSEKVSKVEELLKLSDKNNKLAFVGDGINDAPVLMRSDIGIAMGSMGSDAAIEAADVVLMDDDIRKIPLVVRISVKTMRIVKENIVFALGVKLLVLLLGALGAANMWEAVFADVGVSVIAIINATRT